jgi:hypothetical protein
MGVKVRGTGQRRRSRPVDVDARGSQLGAKGVDVADALAAAPTWPRARVCHGLYSLGWRPLLLRPGIPVTAAADEVDGPDTGVVADEGPAQDAGLGAEYVDPAVGEADDDPVLVEGD